MENETATEDNGHNRRTGLASDQDVLPIRKIAKNWWFNFLTTAIMRGANVIIFPLQAHFLGKGGYGLFSYSVSFASLWVFWCELGLGRTLSKEIAFRRAEAVRLLGTSIASVGILGLLVLLAGGTAILFLPVSDVVRIVCFILLFEAILSTLMGIVHGAFVGLEKMQIRTGLAAFNRFFVVVTTLIVLLWLEKGIVVYALGLLGCGLLQFAITFIVARRTFGPFVIRPERHEIFSLFSISLPFYVSMLLGRSLNQVDSIMLMHMCDENAVGLYNAAYRFVFFSFIVPGGILDAAFPTMSRMFKSDPMWVAAATRRLVRLLGIIAIPIVLVTVLNSETLIRIVCGGDFLPASVYLSAIIWSSLVSFMTHAMTNLLDVSGRQADTARSIFIGALVNIAGNLALIPFFGVAGAIFATILARCVMFFFALYFIRKRLPNANCLGDCRPVLITLLACVVVFHLNADAGIVVRNIVLAGTWAFVGIFSGGMTTADFVSLRETVRRKKTILR